MDILAPAKINLTLRILGKRADGYHELESVMQMLTLADRLTITDAETLHFTCSDPALATAENLVVRAAKRLRLHSAIPRGAHIHLDKVIPTQAGLGGGSSDAAAALLALNEFWELRLPMEALAGMAAELGSDVPFFLDGPTAVVRGRGEYIAPVARAAECHVVLAKPATGLSTAEVYARLAAPPLPATGSAVVPATEAMVTALASGNPTAIARALINDMQSAAFALLPELDRLSERMLQQGCLAVLLCGSGSTLFGICPNERIARHAALDLTNDSPWTWAGPWMTAR